jgi:hypothetical protein
VCGQFEQLSQSPQMPEFWATVAVLPKWFPKSGRMIPVFFGG